MSDDHPYRGTTPHWHSLCLHPGCRQRDLIGRPPGDAFSTYEAAQKDAYAVAQMESGARWYQEERHQQTVVRCFHTQCRVKESQP